jgi:two-component system, chemotaxis family, CheB/CheR fusion protein
VNLTVRPMTPSTDATAQPNLFLVVFEEAPVQDQQQPDEAAADDGDVECQRGADLAARIAALKQELRAKEEYLQTANEELETSNEELKSSNEEMQSINEELQSTNEELETSKEELQSINEELATVNAELQTKVVDLSRANNDLNNLLAGTGIATIFVDHQLRILRFTPTVTKVISLIVSDVGRPVDQIVSNLVAYDRLVSDIQAVLDTLEPKEVEVQTRTSEWYMLRIRPYRTLENVIEGAVVTFVDITEMKRAEETLREAKNLQRLAVVLHDAYDAIVVQDLEGRILAWNPAAERMYGWSEAEALTMNAGNRIPENRSSQEMAIAQRLCRADVIEPYRTQRLAKDGSILDVWLTATALVNETGQVHAIATTERKRAPKSRAESGVTA